MKKVLSLILCLLLVFTLAACSSVDPEYGKSAEETASKENIYKNVKIPEIKSEDDKMPTYVDISLYDEENYADIYLGKKFELNANYAGTTFKLPAKLADMEKLGFKLINSTEYNDDSQVMAGKTLKVTFENENGKQIDGVFFNADKTSVHLKNCNIVKLKIPVNVALCNDARYDTFNINGINNTCAITDVVEVLGAPSHFYAVTESEYYFDWFVTSKDKRNGITVYVNLDNDTVTAIEFSNYKE